MTKFLGGEEIDHMQKCRAREVRHVGAVDKDGKRHSQFFMSWCSSLGKKKPMTVFTYCKHSVKVVSRVM